MDFIFTIRPRSFVRVCGLSCDSMEKANVCLPITLNCAAFRAKTRKCRGEVKLALALACKFSFDDKDNNLREQGDSVIFEALSVYLSPSLLPRSTGLTGLCAIETPWSLGMSAEKSDRIMRTTSTS